MKCVISISFSITLCISICWAGEGPDKHHVYVGARVCATCHQTERMGHQFSKWLASKHAGAYAVLAKPEARKIADLSGIPREPQEAPMCLGCHATGAHAEDWEKDNTFHVEDGVQCEKCHGPGSEYMDAAVMADHDAAVKAGLVIPKMLDCLGCHQVKGSHVAVHKLPKLDMEKAWRDIAHPTAKDGAHETMPPIPDSAAAKSGKSQYVGVYVCARCHKGPEFGYQFSKWRVSRHAIAYASLATPEAYAIARKQGVKTSPQASADCLKCHTTIFTGSRRRGS